MVLLECKKCGQTMKLREDDCSNCGEPLVSRRTMTIMWAVICLSLVGCTTGSDEPEATVQYSSSQVAAAPPLVRTEPTANAGPKWYEGGTLHQAGALDWQKATSANKLATCSDFVASAVQGGQVKSSIAGRVNSVDDLKPLARELVVCIDAATEPLPNRKESRRMYVNQRVPEMAAACVLLMGWME